MLDRTTAKLWQKLLGGLTTAMLLLPVPAFAFTWVNNWVATGVSNAGWSSSDATNDSILNVFPTTLNTTSPNVSATITLTRTIDFSASQAITVTDTNSGNLGANTTFNTSVKDLTTPQTLINYSLTGPGALANGNQFSGTAAAGQYVIQVTFQLNSPSNGAGWNVSSPTSIYEIK